MITFTTSTVQAMRRARRRPPPRERCCTALLALALAVPLFAIGLAVAAHV